MSDVGQIVAFGIGAACLGGLIVFIVAGLWVLELRKDILKSDAARDTAEKAKWRYVHERNEAREALHKVRIELFETQRKLAPFITKRPRDAKGHFLKVAA